MIPAYHCNEYLPRCLESVLAQDPGFNELQLVVVNDDPTAAQGEEVVKMHSRERAIYHKNERNLGAGGNFNRCIALATGELVLLLHGDCFLLPGFFEKLGSLAKAYPTAGMIACRAIGVDEKDRPLWDSHRYREFETLTQDDSPIWEQLHLMPSAVVVRREVYSRIGGFREDIANGQDWEMWSRVIHFSGVIMTHEILAAYRQHGDSISGRTMRTAQNIRDFAKLYRLFAAERHGYPLQRMIANLRGMAYGQARQFQALGDSESAAENTRAWAEITPPYLRILTYLKDIAKSSAEELSSVKMPQPDQRSTP